MSYVNGDLPDGRAWTRSDERQLLPGQANSRRSPFIKTNQCFKWKNN